MTKNSSKVAKFLQDNPDFKKNYKDIHSRIQSLKTEDIKSLSADTAKKIEQKTGSTINLAKMVDFANVAKKMNHEEFLYWISGDSENMPAVQLTKGEMALIQGGGFWGQVFSGYLVVASWIDDHLPGGTDHSAMMDKACAEYGNSVSSQPSNTVTRK